MTFSGGEPFCQPEALYELGSRFKAAGKHLMCYSGWTFEELLKKSGSEEYVGKLLSILDVLVDGRFDISTRSLSLLFRGISRRLKCMAPVGAKDFAAAKESVLAADNKALKKNAEGTLKSVASKA